MNTETTFECDELTVVGAPRLDPSERSEDILCPSQFRHEILDGATELDITVSIDEACQQSVRVLLGEPGAAGALASAMRQSCSRSQSVRQYVHEITASPFSSVRKGLPSVPAKVGKADVLELAGSLEAGDPDVALKTASHVRFTQDALSLLRQVVDIDRLGRYRKTLVQNCVEEVESGVETLVRHNLKLVSKVSSGYVSDRSGIRSDAYQEGVIGLLRGVEKYDWRSGFRLSTYAHQWVQQAIDRQTPAISRVVRVPVHCIQLARRAARYRAQLEKQGRPTPSQTEVAAALGVPIRRLRVLEPHIKDPLSLDMPYGDDGSLTLGSTLIDENVSVEDSVGSDELVHITHGALEALNDRERSIIAMLYGIGSGAPIGRDRVASTLGLSQKRVDQIRRAALGKMKEAIDSSSRAEDMLAALSSA